MALSDPKSGITRYPVKVSARAIPSGLWSSAPGQTPSPKLTISLAPEVKQESTLTLESWPAQLDTCLDADSGGIELNILPLPLQSPDEALKRPQELEASGVNIFPLKNWVARPARENELTEITKLWAYVMPAEAGDDFGDLYGQLRSLRSSTLVTNDDNDIKRILPSVAGQIALLSQLERAMAQMAGLLGPTEENKLLLAAMEIALKELEKLEQVKDPDGKPFKMPSLNDWQNSDTEAKFSAVISHLKAKAAAQLCQTETERDTVNGLALGEAIAGGTNLKACIEKLKEGAVGASCAPDYILTGFKTILQQLFCLYYRNLHARAMGNREFEQLKKTWNEDKNERDGADTDFSEPPPPSSTQVTAPKRSTSYDPHATEDQELRKLRLVTARFQELQENTEFARLFRLVADYELNPTAISFLRTNAIHTDPLMRKTCYFYVRVTQGTQSKHSWLDEEESYWSLAKASFSQIGELIAFVPTTFEEVIQCFTCEAGSSSIEILPRFDGVRLLASKPDGRKIGAELTSVNPRDASQDLDNRISAMLSAAQAASGTTSEERAQNASAIFKIGRQEDEPYPVASPKSRAIRLLDYHRFDRTCRALGMADNGNGENRALDADDLSLGVLFDVALQPPGERQREQREWRPASAALIRYQIPKMVSMNIDLDIEGAIDRFFRGGERRRYQRATAAFLDQVKEEDNGYAAVSDEVAFELTDEQYGTDVAVGSCNTVEGNRGAKPQIYTAKIDRRVMLDIDRSYFELENEQEKPWPLRFGFGVQMADRDIFLGGGSINDDTAADLRDILPAASVPRCEDPQSLKRSGHPFVRTEKITRPQVLLDGAGRSNKETRKNSFYYRRFPPSGTAEVTLRSKLDEKDGTYQAADIVDDERLVILPGAVDLEIAHLHGVWDASLSDLRKQNIKVPPGALRTRARRSRKTGGWPTLDSTYETFPEGRILRERKIVFKDQPAKSDHATVPLGSHLSAAAGDGIYLKGLQDKGVPDYYPDPLHQSYVLRFRRLGTRKAWVGKSLVIEARGEDPGDIEPFPIRMRIRRGDKGSALRMRNVRPATTGEPEHIVEVEVPPGLSLELLIWPLPDKGTLSLVHEVVHLNATLAVRMAAEGCTGPGTLPARLKPFGPLAEMMNCGTDFSPCATQKEAGLAGQCNPTPEQLWSIGCYLHNRLKNEPVDELVGHSSVKIHHAVDIPVITPQPVQPADWGLDTEPEGPLIARRSLGRDIDDGAPALVSQPGNVPSWFFNETERGGNAFAIRDGTDVDLAGYLKIDPASTGAVEILAEVVSPVSERIDNKRGRGLTRIRTGDYYQEEPNVSAQSVYGFRLRTDNRVDLQKHEVTLARFEDIPEFVHRFGKAAGESTDEADADLNRGWAPPVAYLSLHTLFGLASNATDGDSEDGQQTTVDGVRPDVMPILAHMQSRILKLRFRAISRHGPRLTRVARLQNTDFVPPEPLASLGQGAVTKAVDSHLVVLAASRRPAMPTSFAKARPTLLPESRAGDPSRGWMSSRRHARVRISLARPWFSSGDTERLGIILSPRPSTFRADGSYQRDRDALLTVPEMRHRMKERFINPRHLPAPLIHRLSQYCPRGDRPEPWTEDLEKRLKFYPLPLQMFADANFSADGSYLSGNRNDVGYVVSAQLPIYPDLPQPVSMKADAKNESRTPPQLYFPVDLLTYEPRFDTARECWYVDVDVAPHHTLFPYFQLGLVRFNPHAPRDLAVSQAPEAVLCPVLPTRWTSIKLDREQRQIHVKVNGPMQPPRTQPRVETKVSAIIRLHGGSQGSANYQFRDLVEQLNVTEFGAEGSIQIPETFAQQEKFTVLVEEREKRLRSEFEVEPASPEEANSTWSEEGPVTYITHFVIR